MALGLHTAVSLLKWYLFLKRLSYLFWQAPANIPSHLSLISSLKPFLIWTVLTHKWKWQLSRLCPPAMTSGMLLNCVAFACLWVSLPSLHPLHLPPEQSQYLTHLPVTSVYLKHGRYLRCHVEQINNMLHTSLCLYGETKHSKWCKSDL